MRDKGDAESQSAGNAEPFYLWYANVPLKPEGTTPVHIAASDFAGHVKTLDLQIHRRPLLGIQHWSPNTEHRTPNADQPQTWALFVGVDHYPQMITAPPLHY